MEKFAIGQKIKELRKARGYTQAQLAELIGMHEKHISRVESGKYTPSFDNMVKIFNVLDFNIGDFYSEEYKENNPVKLKILKLINSASDKELAFYLGILEQSSKGLKMFR